MRKLLFVFSILFSFGLSAHPTDDVTPIMPPPGTLPVVVNTGFTLINIDSIDELAESFDAHFYFDFRWNDSRLSFIPEEGKDNFHTYIEETAQDKLQEIWWPQLDFVNAAAIETSNTTLIIHSNGDVEYFFGMHGTFRSDLDLRRFPFDKQILNLNVSSFLWDRNTLIFVPSFLGQNFKKPTPTELNSLYVTDIQAAEEIYSVPLYEQNEYSSYDIDIYIQRNPSFYVYQMMVPLYLIMFISFCVFFFPMAHLQDKIGLVLSGILAFFATKFTINEDLPRVGYLTILDKAFLTAYIFGGLVVIFSVLEYPNLLKGKATFQHQLDRKSRWALPLAFILANILIYAFS